MAAVVEDSALGHIPRGRIADSENTGIFNFTDIVWVFQSWSSRLYPSPTSSEKSSPHSTFSLCLYCHTVAIVCQLRECKMAFLLLYSLLLVSSSLQKYHNQCLNYYSFIACYSSPTLFCLFLRGFFFLDVFVPAVVCVVIIWQFDNLFYKQNKFLNFLFYICGE